MTHQQKMQQYLYEWHVNMNVSDFVSVTSNIYHGHEAAHYDSHHDSIDQSRSYWGAVTKDLRDRFKDEPALRILDFGCGTGFATEQLVESSLGHKINEISCYDLSPDMIAQCKRKFASDTRFNFYSNESGLKELQRGANTFDIVVCNALLHHILDPADLFKTLDTFLKPDGVLVMGHEPNKAYYKNQVLQKATFLFRLHKKIKRKFFKPNPTLIGNIPQLTQRDLAARGIVPSDFPIQIIPKFVDIHVPMSNFKDQPWGENGFDVDYINQFLDGRYSIINQISYNHIKDQQVATSSFWTAVSKRLSKLYPCDGADSIFVFKKNR